MTPAIHPTIDLIEAAQRLRPFMTREARQGRNNTSRLFKRLLRARVRHGAMTDFHWTYLLVTLQALQSTPAAGQPARTAFVPSAFSALQEPAQGEPQ